MNTDISVSCSSDQPTAEISTIISSLTSHTNGEDENSVIIWYQNDSEDTFSQLNVNNNEDFIEIDMFPEWPEHEELTDDSQQNSPQNLTADDYNIRYSTFSQDSDNNFDTPLTPPEMEDEESIKNSQEILDGEIKQKIFDSKLKYAVNICNSVNISCYIEGLVAILQIFNRIDCFIEKFAQMTNDCRCTPSLRRGEMTLSQYLLEASGACCDNCSMELIVEKLNAIFLKNVARVQFIPVQQIIDSCGCNDIFPVGASSTPFRYSCFNNVPEPGWLRRWLLKHIGDGVIAGIVYNDLIGNNYNCRPCNKVMFRMVTGFTDTEFQLTIPVENIKDEIIENHLLQNESINVLKSNILKCRHHPDDFERLLKYGDERFNEMNVLGQVIGTFREKSSDSFRGFVPEEVHHIKIPNMHRNGVMLVENI